jgi:hypothetical protein
MYPDNLHQIFDFPDNGSAARPQVVLHTQPGEKGQNQFRKSIRIRLWAFHLDISGDEMLQSGSASSDNTNGFGW